MNKRTKVLQFSKETVERIVERDNFSCLFCRIGYKMTRKNMSSLGFNVFDPMHFIPKGHGGLGIEENGVLGCRYHHTLLDFPRVEGQREEMLEIMEEYLKSQYKDWSRDKLVYRKSDYL